MQTTPHKLTIKHGEGYCSCGEWIRPVSEHSTDSRQSRIRRGFQRHLTRLANGEYNPWEPYDGADELAEAAEHQQAETVRHHSQPQD